MKRILSAVLALTLLLAISVSAFAATPVKVTNGQIIVRPDYEELCPFSVSVKGDGTYFIYLEYQKAPSSTTVSRTARSGASSKREANVGFIVTANSTAEVDVPIGVYKLYYCVGSTWYGGDEKFGENTKCYSSEELLEFYADSQYYQGCSLELWAQTGGNFEDHAISESSFPDIEETDTKTNTDSVGVLFGGSSSGSSSTSSKKYTSIDDLPDSPSDMTQLVKDWLAYPAYSDDFHAVNQEVTIKVGEKTKLELFRDQWYNGASYSWSWYGGGDVSLDWAGNGIGWAGHNQVGYFTATKPCTIFVTATDSIGITAHMVIYAK